MILGTVELGLDYGINNSEGKPSAQQALDLLDTAWNSGIRELDTAVAYGDSEAIIGQYQKETGHYFQIDTKLPVNISESEYLSGFDASCKRLGNKRINLLYLHSFEQCKDNGILSFLLSLKEKQKIDHIGISIYEPDEMKYIMEKLPFVDTIQFPFNLLDGQRWKKGELLEQAKRLKKRLYTRSIYLQGLFFKSPEDSFVQSLGAAPYLLKISELAIKANMTIAELAYKYVYETDGVTEIIVGCQKKKEVLINLELEKSPNSIHMSVKKEIEDFTTGIAPVIIDPRKWRR